MTTADPALGAAGAAQAVAVPPLGARSVRGVLWQTVGLGGEQGLRLLSNVVLARILAPEDFGLMAIVLAAVTAFDAVTHLATTEALIYSDRGRERAFQDTLFWIAALRGILLGLALAAAAPLLAGYYEKPGARDMFVAVGLLPAILGFASPRLGVLEKDLRYRPIAVWSFASTLVATGVTLGLALWLRSAWALVAGVLALQVFKCAGSYLVAPFRPRLALSRVHLGEIRTYFLRAAGTPLLIALVMQSPAFLLGKLHGTAAVGVFLLNLTLADLPTKVSLQAIGRVAIPTYSELKSEPDRLARAWLTALRVVGCVALPLATLLALMGNDLPRAVYRDAFTGPVGLFSLLAVAGGLRGLVAVTGPLFWGVGRPSYDRRIQLLRAALIYGPGIWIVGRWSQVGLASLFCVSLAVSFSVAVRFVRRILDIGTDEIARALWPGIVLALVLAAVLAPVHVATGVAGWTKLALDGAAGTALAAGVALRLWVRRGSTSRSRRRRGSR